MATLALAWVLANPTVTAPIIGASHPDQLAENVAASRTPLPADVAATMES